MTAKEADVRRKLRVFVLLWEIASLALLFLFIRLKVVPDTRGILLLTMFPIMFGLHVIEEFITPGGFIPWDNVYRPQYVDTPGSYYVRINAIPGLGMCLVVLGAFNYRGGYSRMGIASWLGCVAFMSWNAIFHLRGAVQTRRYSPGMATGLAFFWPLLVAGYAHFTANGAVSRTTALECTLVALLAQPVLILIRKLGRQKT